MIMSVIIIIIILGTISESFRKHLCRLPGEYIKTADSSLIGHCTVTSESIHVKARCIELRK
jgi:hypothetical protein